MHILLITFFFPPEVGAPAMRAFELARIMNTMGVKVSVLTGIPNYPLGRYYEGYTKCAFQQENMNGIDVYRSYIDPSDNASKLGRLWSYFTFWQSARRNGRHIADIDVVIATTPPLVTPEIGWTIARRKSIPFVLEMRDITYKQILATGYANPMIANAIKQFELTWARRANQVVCVTDGYRQSLVNAGVARGKIEVIKNGFDFENAMQPQYTPRVKAMIEEIRNKKKIYPKTIGFFGVMGVSQNILALAKNIKDAPETLLVLIGRGAQFAAIQEYINTSGTQNILLYETITEAEIIPFYKEVDFNLSVLRDVPEFKPTIPSKIFRIMGYGALPIFLGPDGEAAAIVKSIDPRLYVSSIVQLQHIDTEEVAELKKKSVDICKTRYNRHLQAQIYIDTLYGVMEKKYLQG